MRLGPAAASEERPCVHLMVADGLSASWTRTLGELRQELARLSTTDCVPATLSIAPVAGGVRLEVTTEDGRRAQRFVAHEASLVSVAVGLVTPIPRDDGPSAPREEPAPSPPGGATPAAGSRTLPPLSQAVPPAPPAVPPRVESWPRAMALWTGLSAGIRFIAPTSASVLDVEARADVVLRSWLLLLSIRSALLSCMGQQGLDCDVYTDVSFGLGVGRRFAAGGPAIDLAFAPSIAVMNMEYDYGPEDSAIRETQVVLRLDASARLAVPLGRGWALTVTLDGGMAPSLVASPLRLSLPAPAGGNAAPPPAFPAWTGGLRLGATAALL